MARAKVTREELAGAFLAWMEQHGYIWFDADLTLAETLAGFLGIKLEIDGVAVRDGEHFHEATVTTE